MKLLILIKWFKTSKAIEFDLYKFNVKIQEVLKDIRRNGKEFDWRGRKVKNVYYAEILKVSAIVAFLKAHKITAVALTGALGVLTDKGIDFLSQGVIISLNNSFVPVGVTSQ